MQGGLDIQTTYMLSNTQDFFFFLHYNCSFILFFVSQALVLPVSILQTLFCLYKQNQSCFHALKCFLSELNLELHGVFLR